MQQSAQRRTKESFSRAVLGGFFLVSVLLVHTACSRSTDESLNHPLAPTDLRENTTIYLGDDVYNVTTSQEEVPSADSSSAPQGTASGKSDQPESGTPTSETKPPVRPVPPPTPRPIDVDFILTKSKTISVGLSSEVPAGRSQNESKPFIPASITKVITTSIALKHLGPNFRFQTNLSFSQEGSVAKDIVIVADGDPTIETISYSAGAPRRMKEMALAIKAKGISEIQGPLTLVSAYPELDEVRYAPGIPNIDMRECYGSLAASFNFSGNCALARIHSKNGFRWEANGISDDVESELATTEGERNSVSIDVLLTPDRVLRGFRLRGTYSSKTPGTMSWRLPIGNAARWYGAEFLNALKNQQIKLPADIEVRYADTESGRNHAGKTASSPGRHRIDFSSADLRALIEATNKPSDNFFADALFKAAAVRTNKNRSTYDALELGQRMTQAAIEEWVTRDGHPQFKEELNILEGAGLSTLSAATPRAFLSVLRQLRSEPFFPDLWDSLPIAGEEGTLAGRMDNKLVEGRVRAKTGTLTGAYQLVGYIPKSANGKVEYIPFVILTSAKESNRDTVRRFQDALVVKMSQAVRKSVIATPRSP